MKFILKDLQRIGAPPIGTIELEAGYGPVELANLLRSGWLNFEAEMSEIDRKAIAAEQAKNESSLDAIQAEIDAEASKLPDRDYTLEELSPKQLKALCAKRGLATNGNKFDLIDRLQSAPVEAKPKAKKKKTEE
jgi:hypothetical protein